MDGDLSLPQLCRARSISFLPPAPVATAHRLFLMPWVIFPRSPLVMHPHCWCHRFPMAQQRWAAQNIVTAAGSLFVLVDLKGCKYSTIPKTVPGAKEGSSLSRPLISYFFPLSVAVGKTACPSRVKLPWECDRVEEEQGAELHQRQPHHCSFLHLQYSYLLIKKGGPNRPRELLRAYF